ncbi:ParB/RepB/Spo0J family partition protein [Frigidibacter sp. MR17.14]|uniref:ParB/RepB/Spo0J family partition protein n=1 Tax=Frigidibacter sp. MR17.14 TaxID=3126509 RepID=UPI0030130905
MAKRPRLEAPSADDLARLEDEFRRETSPRNPLAAPIAQVAADSAAQHDPRGAEARAEIARDRADAERLRGAEAAGLVMIEIPLEEIDADAIVRDRMALDEAEMTELQLSISEKGLRLPIEVFEFRDGQSGPRYGLISGYRRLRAFHALRGLSRNPRYDRIKALVRDPEAMGGTFVAMVEENEVRANLSQYERGRIAVLAAHQGAFANVEAAVDALFSVASKAKRSKIRSFAVIFEELGDMLSYPEALREKDGLRIATALREGHGPALREALADLTLDTATEELAAIDEALTLLAPPERDPARGGRPKAPSQPRPTRSRSATLPTGFTLHSGCDAKGWYIRFEGDRVSGELVETAMRELEHLLGPA